MRIFLSGPMGSGKSEVAREVAQRARLPLVDLDDLIASKAGLEIRQIFERHGEPVFRAMEQEAATEVLAAYPRCVVALGGGTVVHRGTRRALLEAGLVVTLEAHPEELARRVGEGEGRPLLSGQQVEARLRRLIAERAASYAECHLRLDTTDKGPAAIAEEVLEVARQPPIVVPLGIRSHRVEVGRGVIARLAQHVGGISGPQSVALLVTDASASQDWVGQVGDHVAASGRRVALVALPPGTAGMATLRTVQRIWDAAAEAGADRDSLLIGVGGHRVAAAAGFAAATMFMGLSLASVPTTLGGMADSGVRGESGIAVPQRAHLVGVSYRPRFSISDLDVLRFSPPAERRAGLAEVTRAAWLDGELSVRELERNVAALRSGAPQETERAIRMSVKLGARLVSDGDPGRRRGALLDLGQPVGRAVALAAGRRRLRHGQAVSLGMVAASRVGVALGRTTRDQADRLQRLLQALGLPVDLNDYLSDRVITSIASHADGGGRRIDLAIPCAPGGAEIVGVGLEEFFRMLRG